MLLLLVLLGTVDCYLMNNPEPSTSEQDLAGQVQTLMANIISLQNDVSDLKNQISLLSAKDKSVAFFAYLTTDLANLTKGTSLTFSGMRTNVGNAYDPFHGIFDAPVSGTYNFAFTGSATPESQDHGLHIFLKKNGINEMYIFFDHNKQEWIQHGGSVVLQLEKGDRVWLEVGQQWGINVLAGSRASDYAYHSHFSGFLIQAD
ncbi:complement C1q tumor necrosis factor-related protein 3-like [Saccostrea echinata]|uniref:complement C1q tumor necrosis factor-related protein 3-like n=1 Tax=Saccostrea echinata TaxID=191078 RepID=UPI002A82696F|nr:complement C1q tumor necrosis factor-related protein 3-like [Saccostrea echinata]